MFAKGVMRFYYDRSIDAENLPWHVAAPTKTMLSALARRAPGRALDVGCGAGTHAIYLAKRGYRVTGIDDVPRALEMCSTRAHAEQVEVNWVNADVLDWQAPHQFDLVFDRGCLHSLSSAQLRQYKAQLLTWLAPDADYILVHLGKRHRLDWNPVGPRKRSRRQVVEFLSPELLEANYTREETNQPLPIGPKFVTNGFRFQRQPVASAA